MKNTLCVILMVELKGGLDMYGTVLNDQLIDVVKSESTYLVHELMQEDLVEMVLYGSCARGDYTEDSDIDIALMTRSDRLEAKNMMRSLLL